MGITMSYAQRLVDEAPGDGLKRGEETQLLDFTLTCTGLVGVAKFTCIHGVTQSSKVDPLN